VVEKDRVIYNPETKSKEVAEDKDYFVCFVPAQLLLDTGVSPIDVFSEKARGSMIAVSGSVREPKIVFYEKDGKQVPSTSLKIGVHDFKWNIDEAQAKVFLASVDLIPT
jgi:hypothetical protein